jgi:hypothetical protein
MDETYRMLGREHDADLEREAIKRRRVAELRGKSRARTVDRNKEGLLSRAQFLFGRMRSFLGRRARFEVH